MLHGSLRGHALHECEVREASVAGPVTDKIVFLILERIFAATHQSLPATIPAVLHVAPWVMEASWLYSTIAAGDRCLAAPRLTVRHMGDALNNAITDDDRVGNAALRFVHLLATHVADTHGNLQLVVTEVLQLGCYSVLGNRHPAGFGAALFRRPEQIRPRRNFGTIQPQKPLTRDDEIE